MSKTSGLGDNAYVGGYDLSGDVASIDQANGGPALGDVTAINKSGHERLGLLRSGGMAFTSFFESTSSWSPLAGSAALSALPRTDVIASYFRGTAVGNPAFSVNGKQVDYDPTRSNTGELTLKVQVQSNGFGAEWGEQLTAGLRTDTTATTGAFFDDTAGSSFGGQAYFHLVAFSGTSVTIDIQSATTSGGTYSTTGLTTTAMTAIGAQRLATSNTTTINRFLKVVTTGTFTNAKFAVVFVRNATAGVVF